MKTFIKAIASFFYIGHLPIAPGTFGSVAGLLLAWTSNETLTYVFLPLCVAGFLVAAPAENVYGAKDPKQFVLDEVCGMMLGLLWLPKEIVIFIIAFLLFRLLDVWKPWPVSLLQKNKNPLSIMWDDLACGIAVNVALQAGMKLWGAAHGAAAA